MLLVSQLIVPLDESMLHMDPTIIQRIEIYGVSLSEPLIEAIQYKFAQCKSIKTWALTIYPFPTPSLPTLITRNDRQIRFSKAIYFLEYC